MTAERADSDPKVFTKIHVHFIVTGKNLNPRQVERAIKLSAEKYCSARPQSVCTPRPCI